MLSEFVYQLAQRTVLKPELISHFLLRSSIDKDRSQRFVPSMIGLGWSYEVPLISRIVHERASLKMSVDYRNSRGPIVPGSVKGREPNFRQ